MIDRFQIIDSLQMISILCFLLAGVLFVVAVILCVMFRIPSIIGFLTGRKARRAVEKAQKSLVRREMKEIQKQSTQAEPKDAVDLPIENVLVGGETEVLYAAYTQKLYTEEPVSESVKTIESEHLSEYFKLQVEDEIEFINSEERIAVDLDRCRPV